MTTSHLARLRQTHSFPWLLPSRKSVRRAFGVLIRKVFCTLEIFYVRPSELSPCAKRNIVQNETREEKIEIYLKLGKGLFLYSTKLII